jgi:hypothetical protein
MENKKLPDLLQLRFYLLLGDNVMHLLATTTEEDRGQSLKRRAIARRHGWQLSRTRKIELARLEFREFGEDRVITERVTL